MEKRVLLSLCLYSLWCIVCSSIFPSMDLPTQLQHSELSILSLQLLSWLVHLKKWKIYEPDPSSLELPYDWAPALLPQSRTSHEHCRGPHHHCFSNPVSMRPSTLQNAQALSLRHVRYNTTTHSVLWSVSRDGQDYSDRGKCRSCSEYRCWQLCQTLSLVASYKNLGPSVRRTMLDNLH